jgi:hypothetical protein
MEATLNNCQLPIADCRFGLWFFVFGLWAGCWPLVTGFVLRRSNDFQRLIPSPKAKDQFGNRQSEIGTA